MGKRGGTGGKNADRIPGSRICATTFTAASLTARGHGWTGLSKGPEETSRLSGEGDCDMCYMWMNLEDIKPHDISQSHWDKYQHDATYMTCSAVKCIETERRMQAARTWGGMRCECVTRTERPFSRMERVQDVSNKNLFNIKEPKMVPVVNLYYVYFTTIIKFKRKRT